jgi:hypothetical protein
VLPDTRSGGADHRWGYWSGERLAWHAYPARPTLADRRKTRQLMVGTVGVGSDHPISVQSMTTT